MPNLSMAYVIIISVCLLLGVRTYEKINAKYQIHYRLRELANPSRPPLYPIVHIDGDTLSQSFTKFYLKP